MINGTNKNIKPTIIKIKKRMAVVAANELLNFNLFFKNCTNGFAIRHNIREIHRYTITVCISYKKYKIAAITSIVVKALKIPFEIILDVIIDFIFEYKYREKLFRLLDTYKKSEIIKSRF